MAFPIPNQHTNYPITDTTLLFYMLLSFSLQWRTDAPCVILCGSTTWTRPTDPWWTNCWGRSTTKRKVRWLIGCLHGSLEKLTKLDKYSQLPRVFRVIVGVETSQIHSRCMQLIKKVHISVLRLTTTYKIWMYKGVTCFVQSLCCTTAIYRCTIF